MPLERAEIQIKEGTEEEFTDEMTERGLPMLKAVPGVRSVKFGRGIENPSRFIILVDWESVDAHVAFTKSERYAPFLRLFGPYSKGGSMEHFDITQ